MGWTYHVAWPSERESGSTLPETGLPSSVTAPSCLFRRCHHCCLKVMSDHHFISARLLRILTTEAGHNLEPRDGDELRLFWRNLSWETTQDCPKCRLISCHCKRPVRKRQFLEIPERLILKGNPFPAIGPR